MQNVPHSKSIELGRKEDGRGVIDAVLKWAAFCTAAIEEDSQPPARPRVECGDDDLRGNPSPWRLTLAFFGELFMG